MPAPNASGRRIELIGSAGFDEADIELQSPRGQRVPRRKSHRIGKPNFIISLR
jgi:hypothetical protein